VQERLFVILPAAGSGSRMGSERSKIFLRLGTESVLQRTVRLLMAGLPISQMLVMASESDISDVRTELRDLSGQVEVAVGGRTRQESVRLGLEHLALGCNPAQSDLVVVHDAARCFVAADVLKRALQAARNKGAITVGVPVADSLLRADSAEGRASEWVDRSNLWAVQTPQIFRYQLIHDAHAQAKDDATDDASLVATLHTVSVVEGSRENIKLTTPADYEFALKVLLPSFP